MNKSATTGDQQTPRKRKPPSTAWQPGQSGNPAGRPQGSKHQATLAAEALLDGEAEALTRKAVEKALEGDTTALRLCLERLVPPRRDRAVPIDLPSMESAKDALKAKAAIFAAVGCGQISVAEAQSLSGLIDGFVKTVELTEFEARIDELERVVRKKVKR